MGYWIGIILPLASVTGWTAATIAATKNSFGRCFAAVVPAIVAVLYACALSGCLSAGTTALLYGGIAVLAPAVFLLYRCGAFRRLMATPASAAAFASLILFCWWFRDGNFHIWDEFSFWGISSREMLATASLRDASSCIGYCLNYPQATDLLHYFFLRCGGDFEPVCYLGNFVLILSQGLPLLERTTTGKPLAFVSGIATLASLTSGFGLGFYSMCVDIALGMTFGYTAAGAILAQSATDLAFLLPSLALLPLVKRVGSLLAICCVLLAAFPVHALTRGRDFRTTRSSVLVALLLIALPLGAKLSWDRWSRTHDLDDTTFNLALIDFHGVVGAFSGDAPEKLRTIRGNFAKALLTVPVGGLENETAERFRVGETPFFRGAPLVAWIALIAVTCLAAYRKVRPRITSPWAFAVFFIFWGAFLAGMLVLYMFAFDDEEGPALAGYARYVAIWLTGAILVAASLLAGNRGWASAAFAAALLLAAPPNPETFETGRLPLREGFGPEFRFMRSVLPPGSRVYIVWEGSDGFERVVTKYELFPVRTNWEKWNGEPDAATWETELAGYDFVFFGNAKDSLRSKYARLFAPGTLSRDFFFSVRHGAGSELIPLRPDGNEGSGDS